MRVAIGLALLILTMFMLRPQGTAQLKRYPGDLNREGIPKGL
jgi:hypothetical protein